MPPPPKTSPRGRGRAHDYCTHTSHVKPGGHNPLKHFHNELLLHPCLMLDGFLFIIQCLHRHGHRPTYHFSLFHIILQHYPKWLSDVRRGVQPRHTCIVFSSCVAFFPRRTYTSSSSAAKLLASHHNNFHVVRTLTLALYVAKIHIVRRRTT